MESDEKNRMIPVDMIMDDPFTPLLIDYIDGSLSDESSNAVREHLVGCRLCRNTVQSMLHSRVLTDEAKDCKEVWMDSISKKHREQQIASIKQRIQPTESRIRILSRNRAWVSTAAGVVILLFVAFLFLNGTDILTKLSRNSTNAILSPTTDKRNDFGASVGLQEMQSASQSFQSLIPDKYGRTTTQDNSMVLNTGSPLFTEHDIAAAAAKILIVPDQSGDLTRFFQGAVSYLAISDTTTSYQAIAAFPSSMIQAKIEELKVLQGKWTSLSLTTKIEIISRGNAQKLVEYTSKENATLLQTNAENHSADFLVISIYRG